MTSDKVRLSCSLAVSDPGKISLSNPEASKSLKLVATVKQESSPFPHRAVTLLTTYSILDTTAFFRRYIDSPTDVANDKIKIYMTSLNARLTFHPLRGVSDMHQRENHRFITVPPLGQGSVEVTWSLAPEDLLRSYTRIGEFEKRWKEFTVGQKFKIEPRRLSTVSWWTWGSLGNDLVDKKFSCWSLPDDLPIVRGAGEDEGDEINGQLIDSVDRKNVRSIISRWNRSYSPETDEDGSLPGDSDDEEPPKVREMRMEDWVFGEPIRALELRCDQTAILEFVE